MQNRYSLLCLATICFCKMINAQTTYLPLWSKESWTLERLEIKAQRDNNLNLSTVKPYMRKAYVEAADSFVKRFLNGENPASLTKTDLYNLGRLQANSSEYSGFTANDFPEWKTKKAGGNGFFNTRANVVEVNNPNFFLSLNPALSLQQGFESENDNSIFSRSLGITGRGLISKKVGFQFLATANSESGPLPFRQFVQQSTAVPGVVNFKQKADSVFNYADIRGSLTWKVTKYINMQFGRDQQFIGNGYRSLFLSNFSAPQFFFKINTRIWKINYTNLYTQLTPTPHEQLNKGMFKKYTSMHHLGINLTPWLTVGAFESVIFGRPDHYDYSYLLPVIFLRSIEQQNGSPDNANLGIDAKANIMKKLQVYGQYMIDEWRSEEVFGDKRNWWGNKQAIQLGAKYVDAFGIKNLDLQGEFNQVRPFMYQFRDTVGAYTQALQPLAHPLGGNLREVIGVVRYQPMKKLYLMARLNLWKQGLDSAGYNFGSNPNTLYTSIDNGGTRPREDNFPMFSGMPVNAINGSVNLSYELLENMFVDGGFLWRSYDEADKPKVNTTVFSFGIRWNMSRRDYDY